ATDVCAHFDVGVCDLVDAVRVGVSVAGCSVDFYEPDSFERIEFPDGSPAVSSDECAVRVGHARANLACFHDRPEDSHTCERHAVEADSCGELERLRVVEAERDGAPGEPCELPH